MIVIRRTDKPLLVYLFFQFIFLSKICSLTEDEMIKTYQGACHCGFIQFEVLAKIDHLRECNCSVCFKRGALIFRVSSQALKILTPLDKLSLYQWGSMTAEDYFCPTCGVLAFRKPSQLTPAEISRGEKPFTGWAINARCLQDLNVASIPVIKINGIDL